MDGQGKKPYYIHDAENAILPFVSPGINGEIRKIGDGKLYDY